MGTPGGGAGAALMVPAAEPSVMTSPVALSVSAIAISGEGGPVRAAAVATAMSEAAPIGWVDPRGHSERKNFEYFERPRPTPRTRKAPFWLSFLRHVCATT